MNRVHASALLLVNWKGVFYERYELDRHVTALEGDNGAGKTTVMIAAYVVLLPDMTRLRFTNLGETGATGGDKGIWGRLGEPGRPSYAALEFRLPRGERVVAGVHLERKGAPTVEPTPFLVTGLADDVRLQDVFLLARDDLELVPEKNELRDNVARLGGRLHLFGSARDYFKTLFDRGITPLRLGTDEERNRFNEMLRTSMTGGMSRGLLSELRSFLLPREGTLADTLQRMRDNLAACRRTRTEVMEARRLEGEISAVYEAGEVMFAAAVAATRQRAEEMSRRVREAEERAETAERDADRAERELATTQAALARTEEERRAAARRLEDAQRRAREVEEALRWARTLAERSRQLEEVEHAHAQADHAATAAEATLRRATRDRQAASEARDAAARGLADLQAGLAELQRRAHAHRAVVRALARAQELLDDPSLGPEEAEARQAEVRARLDAIDARRRELARRIADTDAHRAEHARAAEALRRILGPEEPMAKPYEQAGDALARVARWQDLAARRDELARALAEARDRARRQEATRDRARHAGLSWEPGAGRTTLVGAYESVEADIAAREADARQADAEARDAERARDEARRRAEALEARRARWLELAPLAATVAEHLGLDEPPGDEEGLNRARVALRDDHAARDRHLRELKQRRTDLERQADDMLHAGGTIDPGLLELRDALAAELLATHLDDVGLDEAGELEARLGPLAHALVVADLDEATRRVGARPDTLATVWLLPEGAALPLDAEGSLVRGQGRDVVVDEGPGRRITRVPEHPTLGRAARERHAARLREQARALEPAIRESRQALRRCEAAGRAADALLKDLRTWVAGDPQVELEAERRAIAEADERVRTARERARRARAEADDLRPRRAALFELLPDAALLDPPDHARRVAELKVQLDRANAAARRLADLGDAPAILERHREALRHEPWSDAERAEAEARRRELDRQRDDLAEGLEALEYVAEHRAALAWTEARARLDHQQALVPALQAQLDEAKADLERATAREDAARVAFDRAREALNEVHGKLQVAREQRDEARRRLDETGVVAPTEQLLVEARASAEEARRSRDDLEAKVGALQKALGARESEAQAARSAADGAREEVEDARKQARPAVETWERLRPRVEAEGLAGTALSERFQRAFAGQASVDTWSRARDARARLEERLRSARDGERVLAEVRHLIDDAGQASGEVYLAAWIAVRDWLRSRLPAQVAEVPDPLAALERFREHLAELADRLDRQERDLRGTSESVARDIAVNIRRARGRVARLNRHLEGVRFGSIQGIRVRMSRVERMDQVLRALKTGAAQELLFQPDMPVEEAFAEIFRRFGGGRTGGQKLLDYREYVHLQVEVRRHDGTTWEAANPTRLSTGEAIGVGSALMMVVLTEWEQDAKRLRGRRPFGSVRLLFLDEANRLDQANLATVFELCRNLGLQLLVAAPEVARAEGCTVFRLVRTRGEDGHEVVRVSGRRVVAGA